MIKVSAQSLGWDLGEASWLAMRILVNDLSLVFPRGGINTESTG